MITSLLNYFPGCTGYGDWQNIKEKTGLDYFPYDYTIDPNNTTNLTEEELTRYKLMRSKYAIPLFNSLRRSWFPSLTTIDHVKTRKGGPVVFIWSARRSF